jgi:hypothetical protein
MAGMVSGACSWCALLPSFGILNNSEVLEAWLAENQLQKDSKAPISWIFSLWLFLFHAGGIQAGMISLLRCDRQKLTTIGPVFDSYGVKHTLVFQGA